MERYQYDVTIEEQAARYIGEGIEVEADDAFDPLAGLNLPHRSNEVSSADWR